MKKFTRLTIACLCLLSINASAQITKGSLFLGGGISVGHNKSEDSTQIGEATSFTISPTIGIAVKNNSVAGVRFSYFHSKIRQENTPYSSTQRQNGFTAGFFYRKYLPLGKSFYLFGESGIYYTHTKSNTENSPSDFTYEQTSNGVGANFYPGITYAVNRKIHLELALNNLVELSYVNTKAENTNSGFTHTSKGSAFGFSTNVNTSTPVSVGFRIVLGK